MESVSSHRDVRRPLGTVLDPEPSWPTWEAGTLRDLTEGQLHVGDDAALQRLLDAARIDVAGGARRRARREAELALGEATLQGVLRELADRRAQGRLELMAGPTVTGQVRAVGRDLVVMATDAAVTLVALGAIRVVHAAHGARGAGGGRAASHDVHLVEVLADLAGDGAHVTVWLQGRVDPVRGDLIGAGVDVVLLRAAGPGTLASSDDATVTLPVAAVVAVRVA